MRNSDILPEKMFIFSRVDHIQSRPMICILYCTTYTHNRQVQMVTTTRSRHGFNQVSRAETKQILHIRDDFHMDNIVLATNRGGTDIIYTA
jgi:hypothetical protein